MTKFLKVFAISAAASLVLTVGTVSALGADTGSAASTAAKKKAVEVSPAMALETKEYAEAYSNAFETALKDELSKIDHEAYSDGLFDALAEYAVSGDREALHNDPYYNADPNAEARANAEKTARKECERLGLNTTIGLVKDNDKSWEGTFLVDSIENTKLYFSEPSRFNCTVGGRTAEMSSKSGYSGNYKVAEVKLYYSNGNVVTNTDNSTTSYCCAVGAFQSATITSAYYTLNIYDGTGSGSRIVERACITLIRKGS